MRCKTPFSFATDETVLKRNTDPRRRAILHWNVTAIELAWINDKPLPGALAVGVWSLTAHPGLPLEVLLGRTVLLTVTQWFVRDARETVDSFLQVRAALRCVTLYILVWIFMWWVIREFSSMEKANELSRRLMNDLAMMGYPLGLIYSTVGRYMRV
jgi:hypothetical protein